MGDNQDKLKRAAKLKKDIRSKIRELDKATRPAKDLKQTNREYMRRRRHEDAEIRIPKEKDKTERIRLEADPEQWLKHFFPERFYLPFGKVHHALIDNIVSRAKNGGDVALAAPRGEGKSEVCIGLIAYLICARVCKFPVIIAATGEMAKGIYDEVRYHIECNDELAAHYPEVCIPVRALEGTSSRAAKQHVNGKPTKLKWDNRYFTLATIEGSPYSGVCMRFFGMDAAFRGVRVRGLRPDFVLVDDPETEQSAASTTQTETRKKLLTRAVAGLAGPGKSLSICVITTLQNDHSLSAQVTDPGTFPSFNGMRFGVIEDFPTNKELWDEYIELRKTDQRNGDELGSTATQFYLDNREQMDAGAVVSNPHRFNKNTEHSTLQSAYNFIADRGEAAFQAELQNDPIPDQDVEQLGLTPNIVQSRLHFNVQSELPEESDLITIGLDIGKYASHWVAIAWDAKICSGKIFDYGVIETVGLGTMSDEQSVEQAIYTMLLRFREEVVAAMPKRPNAIMVDSGDFTPAVYKFVGEAGSPFFAVKGWGGRGGLFTGRDNTSRRMYGDNWFASIQQNGLVLYNVNSDHWKLWTQQRFITRTYDEGNSLVPGSLSLFATGGDKRKHHSYAYHITAEELHEEFIQGKGIVRKWKVLRKNNHWLDATSYACSASSMLGLSLQNVLT